MVQLEQGMIKFKLNYSESQQNNSKLIWCNLKKENRSKIIAEKCQVILILS